MLHQEEPEEQLGQGDDEEEDDSTEQPEAQAARPGPTASYRWLDPEHTGGCLSVRVALAACTRALLRHPAVLEKTVTPSMCNSGWRWQGERRWETLTGAAGLTAS